MKILFIKPALNRTIITTTRYEPLEFEYLAASVPGHRTEILDMRIDRNLHRKIASFQPDLVGTTAYTCDVKTVTSMLREIKNEYPGIHTVVGGNHATFSPGDFNREFVNAVFLGYADSTFPRYVKALEKGEDLLEVPGLGIPNGNGMLFTATSPVSLDLDSLPMPARHLTEEYRSRYHDSLRSRIALIMTSRGCPFRCTFCACWKLMKGRYATRSVDGIVLELKELPPDVDTVYFSDDNTVHNVDRAYELAEKIKSSRINKKLQMYARSDTIVANPELFASLRGAGLEYLTIGLEAFSDQGLEKLNKKTDLHTNDQAIGILKKLGVHINAHFIVDPAFDQDDFDGLLDYVDSRHLFRPAYPVLTPLPGTRLYEQTRDTFAVRDYDFFDFAHSILPTHLKRKTFYHQLARLYNQSYSLQRFVRFWYASRREGRPFNTDGISFFKLLLIRIFAVVPFLKIRNGYRAEPGQRTRSAKGMKTE
jgi:radical SAM superfamily enzyme YgiQ (UPF0313 family)